MMSDSQAFDLHKLCDAISPDLDEICELRLRRSEACVSPGEFDSWLAYRSLPVPIQRIGSPVPLGELESFREKWRAMERQPVEVLRSQASDQAKRGLKKSAIRCEIHGSHNCRSERCELDAELFLAWLKNEIARQIDAQVSHEICCGTFDVLSFRDCSVDHLNGEIPASKMRGLLNLPGTQVPDQAKCDPEKSAE